MGEKTAYKIYCTYKHYYMTGKYEKTRVEHIESDDIGKAVCSYLHSIGLEGSLHDFIRKSHKEYGEGESLINFSDFRIHVSQRDAPEIKKT